MSRNSSSCKSGGPAPRGIGATSRIRLTSLCLLGRTLHPLTCQRRGIVEALALVESGLYIPVYLSRSLLCLLDSLKKKVSVMDNMNSSYDHFREAPFGPPFFAPTQPNPDYQPNKITGPTVTGYSAQETPQQESKAFLPGQSSRSSSITSSRNYVRRVPWRGLLAIAASSVTVFVSLTILLTVNHHVRSHKSTHGSFFCATYVWDDG